MAKQKFYAVRKGYETGIFTTWDACQRQTHGYPGAEFKSFPTKEEAEEFLRSGAAAGTEMTLPEVYAFTDGSYHETLVGDVLEKRYGFGGFLHYSESEEDIPLQGCGTDPCYAESRNVAGEVLGAIAAMKKAVALGLPEMTLFYDYEGIERWPTRLWKTNKPISQMYVKEYDAISDKLKVRFCHVKAHTGIPGNELADQMAKDAVGIDR